MIKSFADVKRDDTTLIYILEVQAISEELGGKCDFVKKFLLHGALVLCFLI